MCIECQDGDGIVGGVVARGRFGSVFGFRGGCTGVAVGVSFKPFLDSGEGIGLFECETLLEGEPEGTVSGEEDVGRFLHDASCEGDGVPDELHGGDSATSEGASVHDAGVEGEAAEAVGQTAEADGVAVGQIIFDSLSASDSGIEGGRTAHKQWQCRLRGFASEGPGSDNDRLRHVGLPAVQRALVVPRRGRRHACCWASAYARAAPEEMWCTTGDGKLSSGGVASPQRY